ncbi:sensor domain-containing diguanylate cyclase [Natronospira bacteriovora]|uniref:diguanylate cyclase n=1 Tax=Natronospira bacteriovora TaxID=3069753 RepID=A0ABU0W4X5_9GAMM|nr:sensor domain-containing diguanylate cyclase [Natronospira sp. AB-CW4]MDQ2069067.1 diguanylate cyclase [Natronospira sp. AB-CW4]
MDDISSNRDPAELRKMLDYLGVAAFLIDVDSHDAFRLAAINARHEQLTGMKHDDVAGCSVDDLLSPEMAANVKGNYRRCVEGRAATDYREVLDLPAGRTYWHTALVPLMDDTGRITRLLGTAHEISDTLHLELETRYQSTVLSAYLDESPDGILVVDADNTMRTWNRRFLELWSIPEAVMEARDGEAALKAVTDQLVDPEDFIERVKALYASLEEEEQGMRIDMKDGRVLERYSRGLHGPAGVYWGRIWFYRDVTDRERMTEELRRLSQTDPLTGAANRRVFMDVLREEYERARRYRHPLSMLMLDLDRFKQINDGHGHAAGDEVLKRFVDVCTQALRSSDCLARMGGEEFAILLPETDLQSATRLAERLRCAVAGMAFSGTDGPFAVTVSIGVTDLDEKDTAEENLLARADKCLYAAKAEGRNCVFTAEGLSQCRQHPA